MNDFILFHRWLICMPEWVVDRPFLMNRRFLCPQLIWLLHLLQVAFLSNFAEEVIFFSSVSIKPLTCCAPLHLFLKLIACLNRIAIPTVGLTKLAGMGISAEPRTVNPPDAASVLQALRQHGITDNIEMKRMEGSKQEEITKFIAAQSRPVFLLHYEDRALAANSPPTSFPSSKPTTLAPTTLAPTTLAPTTLAPTASSGGAVPPLTEFQIAQYQITFWTALGLVMLVATAVGMVAGMEIIPDSLLFAKFQSTRANKID